MMVAVVALVLVVLALLGFIAWRERETRQEREQLIQRIQAPERAIARFDREQAPTPAEKPRNLVSDDEAQLRAIRQRDGLTEAGEGDDNG